MPNIAAVLKDEIARVARKTVRQDIDTLKKALSGQRAQIAQLKRLVQAQQRLLAASAKASARQRPQAAAAQEAGTGAEGLRFSATRLAAQRKRLGLSAQDFGRLVGATGQSIYAWEAGKTRPSPAKLQAIASLRQIGKRELTARLAALG
jgi:DNA-binding transcriptional regulator YiaG